MLILMCDTVKLLRKKVCVYCSKPFECDNSCYLPVNIFGSNCECEECFKCRVEDDIKNGSRLCGFKYRMLCSLTSEKMKEKLSKYYLLYQLVNK